MPAIAEKHAQNLAQEMHIISPGPSQQGSTQLRTVTIYVMAARSDID
jgi:hypothetical protein